MLRLGLSESGKFFPYLTHNSGEALHAASQNEFSLVIIDTEIPGPSFRELWKDLQSMHPEMQLVLIFPEAEEDYPSLDGVAPLGCVDHLLYMPDFLELVESAFPGIEESIAAPVHTADMSSQPGQPAIDPPAQEQYETAWLEDTHIASKHLEEKLPVCSAKAAMIARFDKVLAYSDQLEVINAQEIANRFTRYWNNDGKTSDLVRFIHLGPMNHAYLLYVTPLVNDAVLAALYPPDTPLSQPHRQISKLARLLLSEAPLMPKKDTGALQQMDPLDKDNMAFSERMRMVTGGLGERTDEDVPDRFYRETENEPEPELDLDTDDDVFDPGQFNLDELLANMPSPDPQNSPIPQQDTEKHISQEAMDSLRSSSEFGTGGLKQPPAPSEPIPAKPVYPWEAEFPVPETPDPSGGQEMEEPHFPWETETAETTQTTQQNEMDDLPFPWETEDQPQMQTDASTEDIVESLRYPWETDLPDTGSLQTGRNDTPRHTDPFIIEQPEEEISYPWRADTGELKAPPPTQEQPPEPTIADDLDDPWETHSVHLTPPSPEDTDKHKSLPPYEEPDVPQQDAVETLRASEEAIPNRPENPEETIRIGERPETGGLAELPPNGHEEYNDEDFEPLPDFSDLEDASDSPLGNGWQRQNETREVPTAGDEAESQDKVGTSPLKRPALRVQPEEEDDEYSDCVYTYTTFITPLLKRHALTRELAQILAKNMNEVFEKNHWKLVHMTARPSGMLWTARIPPSVTTGQMVKIIREKTSDMLYEVHPRLKYEALSENFWAANYLVVSGTEPPDDQSIKEFLTRIHQSNRSNGSRH